MQINCSGVLSPPAELSYLGRPSLREGAFVIPDPDTVRYPYLLSSGRCSYERPTRCSLCGTMRSMCGAQAGVWR